MCLMPTLLIGNCWGSGLPWISSTGQTRELLVGTATFIEIGFLLLLKARDGARLAHCNDIRGGGNGPSGGQRGLSRAIWATPPRNPRPGRRRPFSAESRLSARLPSAPSGSCALK